MLTHLQMDEILDCRMDRSLAFLDIQRNVCRTAGSVHESLMDRLLAGLDNFDELVQLVENVADAASRIMKQESLAICRRRDDIAIDRVTIEIHIKNPPYRYGRVMTITNRDGFHIRSRYDNSMVFIECVVCMSCRWNPANNGFSSV
ncbi:hypothetical protein ACOME3_003972 [Neoechinorhynchus agilis]